MKALKNIINCNKRHLMWDLTKMGTYVSLHFDIFFKVFHDDPWGLKQVTFLPVHKYIGVLDGDLPYYVLTANSSRADKSYACMHACMHINTHIHSAVISEAKTFSFYERRGGYKIPQQMFLPWQALHAAS
jgi:hypothetical protein